MKVKIQAYTKKGFYGPEIETTAHTVAGIGEAVMLAFDKLPDNLEGQNLLDWTRIKVFVERK